jgi:hypothetical protein
MLAVISPSEALFIMNTIYGKEYDLETNYVLRLLSKDILTMPIKGKKCEADVGHWENEE